MRILCGLVLAALCLPLAGCDVTFISADDQTPSTNLQPPPPPINNVNIPDSKSLVMPTPAPTDIRHPSAGIQPPPPKNVEIPSSKSIITPPPKPTQVIPPANQVTPPPAQKDEKPKSKDLDKPDSKSLTPPAPATPPIKMSGGSVMGMPKN